MTSIIIPAYNAEKYISETINSVLAQTYTDWELIVIDDGSKDKTAQIVKKFEETDKRIKYSYQTNSGVSSARNNGIKKCAGEFIAFLDADDIWTENNLEERIHVLKSDPETFWAFSQIVNFSDKHEFILDRKINISNTHWLESILIWEGDFATTPSNIIIKKECVRKGNVFFDTNLSTAADQDFCIQLASKYKGKYIPKPLVRYRVLENSMSRNIAVMEKDHIAVYKKASKHKLFKSFWFKQKCFSNLYWTIGGSWWKDANNKKRGLYFIFKAIIANPFSIFRIFNKSIS